jgi:hypothetical protein
MKNVILMGLIASAAPGCIADGLDGTEELSEAGDVSAEEESETPYYNCWSGAAVSPNTSNDYAWKYVAIGGPWGERGERIRERQGHEYSLDVQTYYTYGDPGATQRRWYFVCQSGTQQFEQWGSWNTGTGLANPGCPYPGLVAYGNVRVRAAVSC